MQFGRGKREPGMEDLFQAYIWIQDHYFAEPVCPAFELRDGPMSSQSFFSSSSSPQQKKRERDFTCNSHQKMH